MSRPVARSGSKNNLMSERRMREHVQMIEKLGLTLVDVVLSPGGHWKFTCKNAAGITRNFFTASSTGSQYSGVKFQATLKRFSKETAP